MSLDPVKKFNQMAWYDRWTLKGADAALVLTGAMRDDTKKRPWMYPLYALALLPQLPVIPGGVVVLAIVIPAVAIYAAFPVNNNARWLRGQLSKSFNEQALATKYDHLMVEKKTAPGSYRLAYVPTSKHIVGRMAGDAWGATKHAWTALKNSLS